MPMLSTRMLIWVGWGAVYLALLLGWRSGFHVWSQINDFHYGTWLQFAPIENFTPGEAPGLGLSAHLPRVALTLPILVAAKAVGRTPHEVFTVVAVALLAWSAWLLGRASGRRDAGFWVVLSGLSLAMNGRMIFALAGASLLIWAAARQRSAPQLFLATFTACFFCSVSSGALPVAVAAVGLLLVDRWKTDRAARHALLATLVLALPWFLASIEKNVSYYAKTEQGVLLGLLSHGLGQVLMSGHLAWMLAGTAAATLTVAWAWPRVRPRAMDFHAQLSLPPFALTLLALGAAGGLFGYSTAVMAVPGVLVVGACTLTWWRRRPAQPTA